LGSPAGAEIRAVRSDGSIERYVVHEIRQVPWNDLDILKPTPFEQIVLLTCTSYNPYDPRLLIIGTPA
jgi:sortase (surface protein transpeptidase)